MSAFTCSMWSLSTAVTPMLRTSRWWRNRAYIVLMGMRAVSSWLKKPPPAPFFSSTPITWKLGAVDLHDLADGVVVAEQVGDHVLPEHDDVPLGAVVLVREEGAAGDVPVAHHGVVRRGADEGGLPVVLQVLELLAADRLRLHAGDVGHGRLDGGRIVDGERADRAESLPHPADVGAAGHDGEEVAAQALDPLRDARGGALPDGDHGDHGADADEDAEDR